MGEPITRKRVCQGCGLIVYWIKDDDGVRYDRDFYWFCPNNRPHRFEWIDE